MILCKNDNCAHNESGACSVRGEIQLDESAKCLSSIPVEEKKPEVKSKPLDGISVSMLGTLVSTTDALQFLSIMSLIWLGSFI